MNARLLPALWFDQAALALDRDHEFSVTFRGVADAGTSDHLEIVVRALRPGPADQPHFWRYALTDARDRIAGRVRLSDGSLLVEMDELTPVEHRVGDFAGGADAWVVVAVLRDGANQSVVSAHRLPVFIRTGQLKAATDSAGPFETRPIYKRFGGIPKPIGTVRVVAPDIVVRDAVGNLCFQVRELLLQNGRPAELYAQNFHPLLNGIVRPFGRLAADLRPDDTILYFYSTRDPHLPGLLSLSCAAKVAYYHGITAPAALAAFDPRLAATCAAAIEEAHQLEHFDRLAANSAVNARRLVSCFRGRRWRPGDVHIIGPRVFADNETPTGRHRLRSPTPSLLAVGRIKPHKRLDDLLRFFAEFVRLHVDATLSIAGASDADDYLPHLKRLQQSLGLSEREVAWLGSVPSDVLSGLYDAASVYVTMSEDEGFGVPALEAMMHGLPVMAYDIPAVREVVGDAGLLFAEKDFAALARRLNEAILSSTMMSQLEGRSIARARHVASTMDGRTFLSLVGS